MITYSVKTPKGELKFTEYELRRFFALARYGLNQKKVLNLPMTATEVNLEELLKYPEANF